MSCVSLISELSTQSEVTIPGSKSYTNRALIIASLTPGQSRLIGPSLSEDSEALIRALRCLGVQIDVCPDSGITVHGGPRVVKPFHGALDVGPAGTAMRFLTALCAAIPGADITLQGSNRMHQRPIGELVETLRSAGATIEYLGIPECPPLRITSAAPLDGNHLSIDGSTSSQFISALALIGPMFRNGLCLSIVGKKTSTSYLDMTLQSIRDFGVSADCVNYQRLSIARGQSYSPRTYRIEGDASGASYLWGIAALSGSSVTVHNVNPHSSQGDSRFPALLEHMGCSVSVYESSIRVTGPRQLRAISADMELMPDVAQTLAVIAACAQGTSIIRGLKTLRVKETDRIQALHNELRKVGIRSEPGSDFLVVHGGSPHAGQIATYEDHRMAMSFAMLAARVRGIIIEDPQVVAKSFPTFWRTLDQIGIRRHDC